MFGQYGLIFHLRRRSFTDPFHLHEMTTIAVAKMMITIICVTLLNLLVVEGSQPYGTVIGIDLGTTYSCVGVPKFGRIEILANDMGYRITPSVVSFTPEGERLIGDSAKNQMVVNPENTIYDVKRFIGRTYDDPVVQSDMKNWPFKVINKNNKPHVAVNVAGQEHLLSAEALSGMVLGKMKKIAEDYLGEKVTHAVITVPAYFHDAQRQATKDAAAIAGLEVLRIINEPTAAALAYRNGRLNQEKTVLVYDLGGGTFDVTLFKIQQETVTVLGTSGDLHLGGQDFNQNIVDYFVKLFQKKTGMDVSNDKRTVQKLRVEAEEAKKFLSTQYKTEFLIPYFFKGEDFEAILTRAKFEELNKNLFRKTLDPLKKVLDGQYINIKDIDEVLLVGGSTRIPKIQEMLRNFFDGQELNKGINPDEAVAHGATVLAGHLGGEERGDKLIVDVIPHSLGIQVERDIFAIIIPEYTAIPIKKSEIFTTHSDFQKYVKVPIYEGENAIVSQNRLIGEFTLEGILKAPAGVPMLSVTMEIDENGILTVNAIDLDTEVENEVTVKYNEQRISYEELEELKESQEQWTTLDSEFQQKHIHGEL